MVAQREFRDAMAHFAAAVTIVATDGPGGRAGLTASAVTTVSDDPPTLLVCVNRAAYSNAILKKNGVFTVNLLAADQIETARRFAEPGLSAAERFAGLDWERIETGAPALPNALATFDCRLERSVEIGTHSVLFGRVAAIQRGGTRPALVYLGRAYRLLEADPSAAAAAE